MPATLAPVSAGLLIVPLAAFPGLAHVLTTGVLYLDGSNREVFWRRFATFYAAPALLAVLSVLLVWSSPSWLVTALLLAAVYHNTRQSLGILNLTRRLGGPTQTPLRGPEEALVWTTNLACLVSSRALGRAEPGLGPIPATAWAVALLALGVYLHRLLAARGPHPPLSHFAFLVVSATLAWPVLAIDSALLAWALMSFPHQMQYLGLFWTCARRRYVDEGRGRGAHPLLRLMARDLVACLALLGGVACGLRFLEVAGPSPLMGVATGFVLAATLCHYWLDAFVWRGRDPAMRELLVGHLGKRAVPSGGAVAVA